MLEIVTISNDIWLADASRNKMVCLSRATEMERVGDLLRIHTVDGRRSNFELNEKYKGKSPPEIIEMLKQKAVARAFGV